MKKKSFYLWAMMLVAVLCVGFTSCDNDDDDDDEDVVTGEGIVGTWQFISVDNHFYDGHVETENFEPYESIFSQFIKFNANGTGTFYEYEGGYGWDVDGFRYTYDAENQLIITDEDGTQALEVRSLTDKNLVIKFKDTDDNDVDYQVQTYKRVSEDKVKNAK